MGVRARNNELIIADRDPIVLKHVRTVRRVPLEQRWSVHNLEWVRAVPWNRGEEDEEADGDIHEFDVKQGPGRTLTPGEREEIATQETGYIVHGAHLTKQDFEKFGFADRCPWKEILVSVSSRTVRLSFHIWPRIGCSSSRSFSFFDFGPWWMFRQ